MHFFPYLQIKLEGYKLKKIEMEKSLIFLFLLFTKQHQATSSTPRFHQSNLIPLEGSFGHKNHELEHSNILDPQLNLTLTIVTGSLAKTQLVSKYYSSFGYFTLEDKTNLHLKLQGSVAHISQVFQTTFIEYKCNDSVASLKCFASTSEVFIPKFLESAILGILGLEQVLRLNTNYVLGGRKNIQPSASATGYSNFLGPQAAQVYGFPNSTGAGVNIGIISMGGYFNQSDLDAYFTQFGLGTAPKINVVFIGGAQFDYYDYRGLSVENYLDVEIIATVAPMANITFFYGPNSYQYFYSIINAALQQSDVVSCSWGSHEYVAIAYLNSFQALLSQYSQVPFFSATGDDGSFFDVGFPASCPNAIGELN